MKRVIARNVDKCLLLSLSEARYALSQRYDVCLPILDIKNWWITISLGWIIRICFKIETGVLSHSEWLWGSHSLLFKGYQGFICSSKINLNRYPMTYLCSDLGLYRNYLWSLLCLSGIVRIQATLRHFDTNVLWYMVLGEFCHKLIPSDLGWLSAATAQKI